MPVRDVGTAADRGKKATQARFSLSIVVPMLDEEAACVPFFDAIVPVLEGVTDDYEILCVDDGSRDRTRDIVAAQRARNPRIKLLALSRNFGKEAALTAGIDYAQGDAVIPIDIDLQDPPELIPEMVREWRLGHDMVIAVRAQRESDTYLKRTTARWFYEAIDRISEISVIKDAGDFRLLDRKVVAALRALPERNRFMKGLYAWAGFKQAVIHYDRPPRAHGTTKFRYWKLWNFALDGLLSFSTLPLRVWTYIGTVVALLSMIYGAFIVLRTLIFGVDLPGYASVFTAVLFLGGLNMIGLGVLGEYLGRVFMEVKQRPLYVVAESLGLEAQQLRAGSTEPASHERFERVV